MYKSDCSIDSFLRQGGARTSYGFPSTLKDPDEERTGELLDAL